MFSVKTCPFAGCKFLKPYLCAPQVYFLNSELQRNMSKKLNGVPALVIRYDEDFDLNDRDAKEMYAAQVREYFQWVQSLRCVQTRCRLQVQSIYVHEVSFTTGLLMS